MTTGVVRRFRTRGLLGVGMLAALFPAQALRAQSQCEVNSRVPGGRVTCTARVSVSMQLPTLASLAMSTTSTDLTAGRSASEIFPETGYVLAGPVLSVLANRDVVVSLVNAPTFIGPSSKSAADVTVGLDAPASSCVATPMFALSTAPEAVQSTSPRVLFTTGGATTGTSRRLCIGIRWRQETDRPGSYTLPLQVTVTAP